MSACLPVIELAASPSWNFEGTRNISDEGSRLHIGGDERVNRTRRERERERQLTSRSINFRCAHTHAHTGSDHNCRCDVLYVCVCVFVSERVSESHVSFKNVFIARF